MCDSGKPQGAFENLFAKCSFPRQEECKYETRCCQSSNHIPLCSIQTMMRPFLGSLTMDTVLDGTPAKAHAAIMKLSCLNSLSKVRRRIRGSKNVPHLFYGLSRSDVL